MPVGRTPAGSVGRRSAARGVPRDGRGTCRRAGRARIARGEGKEVLFHFIGSLLDQGAGRGRRGRMAPRPAATGRDRDGVQRIRTPRWRDVRHPEGGRHDTATRERPEGSEVTGPARRPAQGVAAQAARSTRPARPRVIRVTGSGAGTRQMANAHGRASAWRWFLLRMASSCGFGAGRGPRGWSATGGDAGSVNVGRMINNRLSNEQPPRTRGLPASARAVGRHPQRLGLRGATCCWLRRHSARSSSTEVPDGAGAGRGVALAVAAPPSKASPSSSSRRALARRGSRR